MAVAAAKLGANCAMVGKLGDDSFGADTLQNFKTLGVNTDFLKLTSEAPSGVAPIFVEDSGENCIVVVGGANNLVSPQDVHDATSLIGSAKVVICQNEIKVRTLLGLMAFSSFCFCAPLSSDHTLISVGHMRTHC
jgi:ribokinase